MDIDIACYPLVRPTRAALDRLGIPYDEGRRTILVPEQTTREENEYGEVYTLPSGVSISLYSNLPMIRVKEH